MKIIEHKLLPGYQIVCEGKGRLILTEHGKKHGATEPVLGSCISNGCEESLCWWVKPVGWDHSIYIPAKRLMNFWHGEKAPEKPEHG